MYFFVALQWYPPFLCGCARVCVNNCRLIPSSPWLIDTRDRNAGNVCKSELFVNVHVRVDIQQRLSSMYFPTYGTKTSFLARVFLLKAWSSAEQALCAKVVWSLRFLLSQREFVPHGVGWKKFNNLDHAQSWKMCRPKYAEHMKMHWQYCTKMHTKSIDEKYGKHKNILMRIQPLYTHHTGKTHAKYVQNESVPNAMHMQGKVHRRMNVNVCFVMYYIFFYIH